MSQPELKYIDLTYEQLLLLEDFFQHVRAEADVGRPGMLVAQIGLNKRSVMRVGYWNYERATAVNEALAEIRKREASASTSPAPQENT